MIEDPLAEHDRDGFVAFTRAAGKAVQVVGDDYLVTSAARVTAAARDGSCNAVLVNPNQAGTLTEALAALEAARECGFGAIVSARSGESAHQPGRLGRLVGRCSAGRGGTGIAGRGDGAAGHAAVARGTIRSSRCGDGAERRGRCAPAFGRAREPDAGAGGNRIEKQ